MRTHPEHFWLGLLAALAIALWLVRGILLPFVLGMVPERPDLWTRPDLYA